MLLKYKSYTLLNPKDVHEQIYATYLKLNPDFKTAFNSSQEILSCDLNDLNTSDTSNTSTSNTSTSDTSTSDTPSILNISNKTPKYLETLYENCYDETCPWDNPLIPIKYLPKGSRVTFNWNYIEGIKAIHIYTNPTEFHETRVALNFIDNTQPFQNQPFQNPEEDLSLFCEAYLLTDEGKTIQRIDNIVNDTKFEQIEDSENEAHFLAMF